MGHRDMQTEELEALEAIYPDELEIVSGEYPNISLKIALQSHREEKPESTTACTFEVTVALRLPADYPDVAPEIEILGLESSFSSERIEQVQRSLCTVAQESLGMPMVFTIVSSLQDEIGRLVEDLEADKMKAEERAKEEKEALERKKFEGTRVTPVSFLEWKKKFDAEMRAINEKEKLAREAELAGKLTGRQLFLRDATLNLSDVALMQAASNEIEFDESLFDEDIEGLDSEESDDEHR